jgi:predicted nucleic acid-binding protein
VRAILVDTSVWRGYFTGRMRGAAAEAFSTLLGGNDEVLVHPAVRGELVLGGLSALQEELLGALPEAPEVPSLEVLDFVKRRKLARRGVGWVDAQILASALVSPALLWSLDKAMAQAAKELGNAFVINAARL